MASLERRDLLRGAIAAPFVAGPFLRSSKTQNRSESPDHFVPADKKLASSWVTTLFAKGERKVFRGKELLTIGMPCGGIAAGQIYVGGDGTLRLWQIMNEQVNTGYGLRSYETLSPPRMIDHGFRIRVIGTTGTKLERDLRQEDVPDVEFVGEHPIAEIRYPAGTFPIEATLRVMAPFVPLATDDSTLPTTMLLLSLRNVSDAPLRVEVETRLENAILASEPLLVARENTFEKLPDGTFLRCSPIAPPASAGAAPEILADFEGGDFGAWKQEGKAFASGPARGARPGQSPVTGFVGKGLVDSFDPDDAATGKLTSPEFTIARRFLNFLIGGGNHKNQTCLNLVVDGKVVNTATGRANEELRWASFDLQAHQGRRAHLEIVDSHTGAWGHVNVDQIELGDRPKRGPGGGELIEQAGFGEYGLVCSPAAARTEVGSGARPIATLVHELTLAPGATAKLDTALVWHFKNRPNGRSYATRFPSLAEVARHVHKELPRLVASTQRWHDTWYDSTLPHWLLDRLHAPVSILQTETCQIWANGRFWAWEGVGCCEGTCTHVWNYEHAKGRLFPELARSTREMQDFGVAYHENGLVGFRGNDAYAADGQCGSILKVYREHLMTTDGAFAKRLWPKVKQATEFLLTHDTDNDGLVDDRQHNTYDIEFYGPNPFVGFLFLAALRAAEELAKFVGDEAFATRCKAVFAKGSKSSAEKLWNGEWFAQRVDLAQHPRYQFGDGCLADQLFGQAWAHQLGLGYLCEEAKVRAALDSIWRCNWAPDVGPQIARHLPERYFARQGEAGLFICTWPKGKHMGDNGVRYRDEVWSGCEYQVASHLFAEGRSLEGLALVRGVHERYDGTKHNPWNEVECGEHYSRAMASWGCLIAISGFHWDGPKSQLRFAPKWQGQHFRCAFTTSAGWGTIARTQVGNEVDWRVAVRYGKLVVRDLELALPEGVKTAIVRCQLGEAELPFSGGELAGSVHVQIMGGTEVNAGQTLRISAG